MIDGVKELKSKQLQQEVYRWRIDKPRNGNINILSGFFKKLEALKVLVLRYCAFSIFEQFDLNYVLLFALIKMKINSKEKKGRHLTISRILKPASSKLLSPQASAAWWMGVQGQSLGQIQALCPQVSCHRMASLSMGRWLGRLLPESSQVSNEIIRLSRGVCFITGREERGRKEGRRKSPSQTNLENDLPLCY